MKQVLLLDLKDILTLWVFLSEFFICHCDYLRVGDQQMQQRHPYCVRHDGDVC